MQSVKGTAGIPRMLLFFVVAVVVAAAAAAAAGTKADFDSSILNLMSSQGASCYSVTWRPVRAG